MSASFGPGPITPAVRAIIVANVAVFLVTFVMPGAVRDLFGLSPRLVIEDWRIWQPLTYLFVHADLFHILFNMLFAWMFGVELERRWGTVAFAKYYFVTGVGAGLCSVAVSLLPFDWARPSYAVPIVGASGAVYGLLLAWGLLFPHRQILFMLMFPLTARMYVIIMGAIAFFSAVGASGTGVAHVAHLGGLLVGWAYLKGPGDLRAELRYRLTRWRMERLRRRFDVHKGGRGKDWYH